LGQFVGSASGKKLTERFSVCPRTPEFNIIMLGICAAGISDDVVSIISDIGGVFVVFTVGT